MNNNFKLLILVFLFPVLAAFVRPVDVNLQELPKVDRWATIPEVRKVKRLKTAQDPLMRAGISQSLENWEECVKSARAVSQKSVVKDWAVVIQLSCSKNLVEEDSSSGKKSLLPATLLKEAIATAEKYVSEWKARRSFKRLNQDVIDSQILLCEWLDLHAQWKELRVQLEKSFKLEELLSKQQKSQIYFFAGDLMVAERQWADAFWQLKRSQEFGTNAEVNAKLKAIMPMLPAQLRSQIDAQLEASSPSTEKDQTLSTFTPSAEELELSNQAQNYLSRGDTPGAIESLAKLLKVFPLGIKAKWAQDKLFEMLVQEIEKSQIANEDSVTKKRLLSVMLEFDSERLSDWGKSLFDKQEYNVAGAFLKKSAELSGGSVRSVKTLYLAARAFQLNHNFVAAKDIFRTLVKNYSSAPEVTDAALQWGLINYNENDPSEAITHLEIVRTRKMTSQQDLVSLFWLYQSYKLKKADAELQKTGQELVKRYPLTYYGLLVSQEVNKALLQIEKSPPKKGKVYFSESEMKSLDRARILLQAGILSAASEELGVFTNRTLSGDEAEYLANFFAQSLHYQRAFSLLGTGFEDLPERRNEFVIRELFPKEYWEYVSDDNKRSGLDPLLLLSVMKQESAFDYQALSHSGAVGLMQMIPPTAEDVKRELKSDAEIPHELEDPSTNVKFCAYYLAKLIKKYDGSIPLALAAYNAGPKRISTFMKSRGPLSDTWVDELPWAEPSFYVKSILKNYIVYRMLYAGLTQLPTPPWANSPAIIK